MLMAIYKNSSELPQIKTGIFQRPYNDKALPVAEKATVLKWIWNNTFNQWQALVEFSDGFQCYTYQIKQG